MNKIKSIYFSHHPIFLNQRNQSVKQIINVWG